ncbi:hypothetical protein BJX68DRAFT_62179 [Aspergillus pseudodeflectus]|uniref:Azaphilone pigments biosynthesis cluster protein L N-terminal domain-containing protein n=1 Tax=Aspergillus pseudodeflectus TaxID=176178 RepID=A0ABR4KM03_9EURO
MAEPIGLAAGILALAEAGFKLSKTLHGVGSSIANARSELTELAGELDNFASVLVSVGEVIQRSDNDGGLSSSDNLVKVTEQILDKCGLEFEKIRKMVKLPVAVTTGSGSIPAWDRIRWSIRKSKTTRLKVSLEYSKTSLMLMLQTLHLAVGLHALRSLEKISDGGDNTEPGRQRKILMGTRTTPPRAYSPERPQPGSVNATSNYIDSAQFIVKNTVAAVCGAAGEPIFDSGSLDIIEKEIQKMVTEYTASSDVFQSRIAQGKPSSLLDSLKRMGQSELEHVFDESGDIALVNEIGDLERDLGILHTVFLAQKELINQMIATCNELRHGQHLFAAINSLTWVSSVIDGCKTQVTGMLRTCRAVIISLDTLIQAKQFQKKSNTGTRSKIVMFAWLLLMPLIPVVLTPALILEPSSDGPFFFLRTISCLVVYSVPFCTLLISLAPVLRRINSPGALMRIKAATRAIWSALPGRVPE